MGKIFYSWQADLPNSSNRGFIEKALTGAVKVLANDRLVQIDPVIDRDTVGVPGSPDIGLTILTKIEQADIFVCDVSIINQGHIGRPVPNPNVLVELGYALKCLGMPRVVMVMNCVFGEPELLPFDLRMKRVIKYYVDATQENKAVDRRNLEGVLAEQFRHIYKAFPFEQNIEEQQLPPISLTRRSLYSYITSSPKVRHLDEKMAQMYGLPLDTVQDSSLWLLEQAEHLKIENVAQLDALIKENGELAIFMGHHKRPQEKVNAGYSIGLVFEVLLAKTGSVEKIEQFYRALKYTSGWDNELLDHYADAQQYLKQREI